MEMSRSRSLLGDRNNLGFGSLLCSATEGDFCHFINEDEKQAIKYDCLPGNENVISCKYCNKKAFLDEVDGLDFNTVKLKIPFQGELPGFIPLMQKEHLLKALPGDVPQNVTGIALGDIFRSRPKDRFGELTDIDDLVFDERLLKSPLVKSKKVVLFMFGQDKLIEKVWRERDKLKLFENIKRLGAIAVTGINFSVFLGECPWFHALSLKKSIKSLEIAESFGLPTIPHFYAVNDHHRKRIGEWLNNNTKVKVITINCQLQKSDNDFEEVLKTIAYISENVKTEVKIILQGPRKNWVKSILKKYKNVIIAHSAASYSACMKTCFVYSELLGDLVKLPYDKEKDVFSILRENTVAFSLLLSRMRVASS